MTNHHLRKVIQITEAAQRLPTPANESPITGAELQSLTMLSEQQLADLQRISSTPEYQGEDGHIDVEKLSNRDFCHLGYLLVLIDGEFDASKLNEAERACLDGLFTRPVEAWTDQDGHNWNSLRELCVAPPPHVIMNGHFRLHGDGVWYWERDAPAPPAEGEN
jgi:hypothetical protein